MYCTACNEHLCGHCWAAQGSGASAPAVGCFGITLAVYTARHCAVCRALDARRAGFQARLLPALSEGDLFARNGREDLPVFLRLEEGPDSLYVLTTRGSATGPVQESVPVETLMVRAGQADRLLVLQSPALGSSKLEVGASSTEQRALWIEGLTTAHELGLAEAARSTKVTGTIKGETFKAKQARRAREREEAKKEREERKKKYGVGMKFTSQIMADRADK